MGTIHSISAQKLAVAAGLVSLLSSIGWSFLSGHGELIPIEIQVAFLTAVCVFGLVSVRRILMDWMTGQPERDAQNLRGIQSALYLQSAAPRDGLLLHFGQMAIEPDFAAELTRILRTAAPRVVVELGSGVSTVLTGMILREQGGKLISIDHDPAYADITRENVRHFGLEAVVEVRAAPLVDATLAGKTWKWYNSDLLKDVKEIDLLVVDGPPAWLQPQSRFPALPVLYNALSPNASVLLDDSSRSDEQALISEWLSLWPEFSRFELRCKKGATHLQRNRT